MLSLLILAACAAAGSTAFIQDADAEPTLFPAALEGAPVSLTNTSISSVFFGDDGMIMFVVRDVTSGEGIVRYELTAPYDASTAGSMTSLNGTNFVDAAFSDTGEDLLILRDSSSSYEIVTYNNLSPAFTLPSSTASSTSNTLADTSGSGPTGFHFSPDGTDLFVVDSADFVAHYTLTNGFVASGATLSDHRYRSDPDNNDQTQPNLAADGFTDIAVSPDGTRALISSSAASVHQVALNTPFSLSSVSYTGTLGITNPDGTSIAGSSPALAGITMSPDGRTMHLTESTQNRLIQYSLVYPFVLFDVSLGDTINLGPFATRGAPDASKASGFNDPAPRYSGMSISPDGERMHIMDGTGRQVHQFNLTTPFDLGSAVYDVLYNFTFVGTPDAFHMSPDGHNMLIYASSNENIQHFTLNTPFDITNGSVNSPAGRNTGIAMTDMQFNSDGSLFYVIWWPNLGGLDNELRAYSTSDFALPNFGEPPLSSFVLNDRRVNSFAFSPDGMDMITSATSATPGLSTQRLTHYSMSAPYDISSLRYGGFLNLQASEFTGGATPSSMPDIVLHPDGTTILHADSSGRMARELHLNTPFDVLQTSIAGRASVDAQEASPTGVAFSGNGSLMFIVGTENDEVFAYGLETPYDVATASYSGVSLAVGGLAEPQGLAFNDTGTGLYVAGFDAQGDGAVLEYTLDDAWDLSGTPELTFTLNTPGTMQPHGISFHLDGTGMLLANATGDLVGEYILPVAFDLENAVLSTENVSLAGIEGDATGVAADPGGTKLFVSGGGGISEFNTPNPTHLPSSFHAGTFSLDDAFTVPANSVYHNDTQDVVFHPAGHLMFTVGSPGGEGAVTAYSVNSVDPNPQLDSSTLDLDEGTLTLGFDEDVDVPAINATGIAILYSNGTVAQRLTGAALPAEAGAMFTMNLTEPQRTSISAAHFTDRPVMMTIDPGAITAVSGFPFAGLVNAELGNITDDSTDPELREDPVLIISAQTLAFNFTEAVNATITPSQIRIEDSGSNLLGTLDGATVQGGDDELIILNVSGATADSGGGSLLDAVRTSHSSTTPVQIDIPLGTFKDLAGNNLAVQEDRSITIMNDTTPPVLQRVEIDLNADPATVTFMFNELMDVAATGRANITVTGTGTGVNLDGPDLTAADSMDIEVPLSETQRLGIVTLHLAGNLQIEALAETFRDISNNSIAVRTSAPVNQVTNDTTAPVLNSASIDLETGQLSLNFSEAIDVSRADADGITIGVEGGNDWILFDADEPAANTADPVITLTEAERQAVILIRGPSSSPTGDLLLDITAEAQLRDLAGNAYSVTGFDLAEDDDTNPPQVVGEPRFNPATGVITFDFDEALGSTVDVAMIDIMTDSGMLTLASDTTTDVTDGTAVLTLNDDQRREVQAAGGEPRVAFAEGAFTDFSSTAAVAATLQLRVDSAVARIEAAGGGFKTTSILAPHVIQYDACGTDGTVSVLTFNSAHLDAIQVNLYAGDHVSHGMISSVPASTYITPASDDEYVYTVWEASLPAGANQFFVTTLDPADSRTATSTLVQMDGCSGSIEPHLPRNAGTILK